MILTIIYFIFIIGFITLIHEGGHFFFAKKAGIYVYEFSIGMGPKIFKWKRKNDETEYSISLFPIGGYVQLAGEGEEDEKIPKEKSMRTKTIFQRFMVVIAGIMNNFLLTIIILFIVGLINGAAGSEAYIGDVLKNSAAENAGIIAGEKITKLNGKKVHNSDEFLLKLIVKNGETITLELDGKKNVTLTPIKDEEGNFKYGFGIANKVEKGLWASIKYAFSKFISLLEQMALTIWYLITGKLAVNNLSGPVGIFNLVGETAQYGFINIIYLVGYLSLNVGVVNLIPIPALDGGRALFLLIEKIKGKPISIKTENLINTISFALLMLLMLAVTYNDIVRIFFN